MFKTITFPKVAGMENPTGITGIPFMYYAWYKPLQAQEIFIIKEVADESIDLKVMEENPHKWSLQVHPITIKTLQRLLANKHQEENVPLLSQEHMDFGGKLIDTLQDIKAMHLIAGIWKLTNLSRLLFTNEHNNKVDTYIKSMRQSVMACRNPLCQWDTDALQRLYFNHLVIFENIFGCVFTDLDPQYSLKDGATLTNYEKDILKTINGCPDCGGHLTAGPRGGNAVNVTCDDCEAKFNIAEPLFTHRISDKKYFRPDK